jgi:hypothetical protein
VQLAGVDHEGQFFIDLVALALKKVRKRTLDEGIFLNSRTRYTF